MRTLLLDQTQWDLVTDAAGNIAVASDPYSIAQDVASSIRLFLGELWYNTGAGVPYFQQILGLGVPLQIVKQQVIFAALRVPQVTAAECFFFDLVDRVLSGQVQVKWGTQTVVLSFSASETGFIVTVGGG